MTGPAHPTVLDPVDPVPTRPAGADHDVTAVRVHDLVRLDPVAVPADATVPAWVRRHLATPWAVVRRPVRSARSLALGLRGTTRGERWAFEVDPDAVLDRVRPEDLRAGLRRWAEGSGPLADTVRGLRPWLDALDDAGLRWGPAGSVGFSLATGRSVVTPTSDLDLVVRLDGTRLDDTWLDDGAARPLADPARAPARGAAPAAALAEPPTGPSRVDVLLETPAGAVARVEAASGAPLVLLRTGDGARLVPNPWAGMP
jgi:phosphoribosyl-dephospho-CoA transferase